jgi:hypothetical protein
MIASSTGLNDQRHTGAAAALRSMGCEDIEFFSESEGK